MHATDHASDGDRRDLAIRRVAVPIIGLSLGGCGADEVERALRGRPGVLDVYVNRANDVAYIRYDAATIDAAGLCQAIEATGLRAGPPQP